VQVMQTPSLVQNCQYCFTTHTNVININALFRYLKTCPVFMSSCC
jgi:hypothetical protein